MKEALSIETERMDDIPLLLTHMQRMQLAALLDKHFPAHGLRKGVSVGELSVVWLAHILSQADHRMNRVQEWGSRRLETMRGCGLEALTPQDLSDDRLADVLHLLSDDVHWRAFEHDLMGHLVRVYEWEARCVRIDTTTASNYAEVNEAGLLQLGQSKDHRPDLPQLKLALASLDPFGLPLASEVLSGEQADDPVYVPLIDRVRSGLQQSGLLYVGDCKMAAMQTRASIQAHGDYYLCPLSALHVSPDQLVQEVEAQRARNAPLIQVVGVDEQGKSTCIAQGYESMQSVTVRLNEQVLWWQERRLLIETTAATQTAQASLQDRLRKAERLLADLTLRRQGKPRLTDRAQVEEAIEAVLKEGRVEGWLHVHIQEEGREHPVRAYRGRLSPARWEWGFQLAVSREEMAIARAMSQLGWRVYATNHHTGHLGLEQAVEAYRDEYLVERNFSRLKGHPLSLAPLFVQRDDHRVGLVRLLTIALRVLTVLEGVVRKQLQAQQEELTGLFVGNPKRRTAQPTAERLLETFRDITLTIVSAPGFAQRQVTPLSALQQQILARCGFSAAVYGRFADDS